MSESKKKPGEGANSTVVLGLTNTVALVALVELLHEKGIIDRREYGVKLNSLKGMEILSDDVKEMLRPIADRFAAEPEKGDG